MIKTNEAPCWYLVDKRGREYDNGDGVPHYESEADARAEAADFAQAYDMTGLTAKALDYHCVTVECDDCGFELDADVMVMHHRSEEDARRDADACGWQTSLGPSVLCENCPPPVSSTGEEPTGG